MRRFSGATRHLALISLAASLMRPAGSPLSVGDPSGPPTRSASAMTGSTQVLLSCCPRGAYAAGRLLVRFGPGVTAGMVEAIARQVGAMVIRPVIVTPGFSSYLVSVPVCDEREMIPAFRAFPEVVSAEVDGSTCPDIEDLPSCACCPSADLICPGLPACPGVLPPPRGSGFWKHQCSTNGSLQVSREELETLLAATVTRSSTFTECAGIGCETLIGPGPGTDAREKAGRELLSLWLNVASDRARTCSAADLSPLSTATTVGQAIDEVETVLCDPDARRADLEKAREIAETLNGGGDEMELMSAVSSLTVRPGQSLPVVLAVVNLSEEARSYRLSAVAPCPVRLSTPVIAGLGAGQTAFAAVEIQAPEESVSGQTCAIRLAAVDLDSATGLRRELSVTLVVSEGGAGRPGPVVREE